MHLPKKLSKPFRNMSVNTSDADMLRGLRLVRSRNQIPYSKADVTFAKVKLKG